LYYTLHLIVYIFLLHYIALYSY